MEKNMIITVLGSGTSQGVPVIGCTCPVCQSNDLRDKRLRTSILIQTDEVTVAVDAGPDFRYQMLREKVTKLDAVLITHEHKDHIGGLDDLRPFIFMNKKPMPLYVADTALPEINREYSYAFEEHPYPGAPTYEIHRLDETPFDLADLHIIPIKLKHFTLTSYAFRIGRFAYVTDLSEISDEIITKLQGVEYLIIEALGNKKHYSHLSLQESIDAAQRIGARKTWFTHCSHSMGLAAEVNPKLPEGMMLAYDGLKIEINKCGMQNTECEIGAKTSSASRYSVFIIPNSELK